jgi:membrane protein YqaA with SNARE-associated domain
MNITLTEPPPLEAPSQELKVEKQRLSTRQIVGRVAVVLFAVGISIAILMMAPQIQRFSRYGYPGIFLVSLIANASIIMPVPSLAVTFTMGAILSWPLVGLVAGVGEALGETTGYLAGYGGSAVVENQKLYTRLKYWMEHHGMLTLFVLSVIPNPFIDLAGITAGALKYSYLKFLLALWVGKTIKTLIFAWAGAHSC